MRSSIFRPTLVLITSFASTTSALLASTSSPCASQCGNTLDSTSGSDIACSNAEFESTNAGTVFENCISCQVRSNYVDPVTKQSDLHWAIYNIRYAVSWCLFGYPNNENVISTPCTTSKSCGLLKAGFVHDSLSSNASTYGFCALVPATDISKCTSCLSFQTSEFYLKNFVTALDAACQQQPTPGNTINIEGSLFSTTAVNITTGSARPASTYKPDDHALTLGAKVGIAVGGLVALLSISGFCIVWRGKRRRRMFLLKHQQETGYADWLVQKKSAFMSPQISSPGAFFDSPQSQRPLVSSQPWPRPRQGGDSPASAMGDGAYSTYSSQYSSPTDASDRFQTSGSSREWPREWPVDRKSSIGGSSGVRSRSREKHEPTAEIIEMQNVAPVLLHPGHGRGTASHLTEDDVQRGGHAV
ncbi:uncharacterized protein L3040_004431 [Drepanopeziza brunnea f. sp. 'multigermtubi']|uniref:LPXTG-domain-containing protein n=1 Tax=Marssonina brunnea f. sp. multigermtubi (strain MB_m1) TaxID=1072389 RepID=K1WXY2_MARBU|nr:LPXTG-domain-containing protein [Drepanopeziza brunnea f. sp. 'multigermtubi' MB_m1]EKD17891.1 LPXTG-domain-containing protein [Drepanopeziza brunnea f. sp. 'multigermtubi' MB_m1]KAJ5043043.1 hypothetical protein L3040_004431 [Drepanopeziza brunnea f. sp. 'multigermtubi']